MKNNKEIEKDELQEKLDFIKSIIQYIKDFVDVTYVGTDKELFNACKSLFEKGSLSKEKEVLKILDEARRGIEDSYSDGEFQCCVDEIEELKHKISRSLPTSVPQTLTSSRKSK